MKKKQLLFIGVSALSMLLAGCGNNNNGGDEPYVPTPVVVDYKIIVNAHEAVHYTLSKDRAVKDEEVILTITSVDNGFNISEVTMNNKALTSTDGGNTYKFNMPNQSANIKIRVSVSGDIVLQGDVVAQLTETEAGSGLYKARVSVPATSNNVYFSYRVGDTVLGVLDLDESKSFADIEMTSGTSAPEKFTIASGSTYDFYYDANLANDAPCYVQRVKVDTLPNDADSLQSVLNGSAYAVRSEPAMFMDDLVGINYTRYDYTTNDIVQQRYTWSKYDANTTYAVVEDLDPLNENPNQVVYRHFNPETNLFQIVDTYAMKIGNKTVNDDKYRHSYNSYGAYSATFSLMEGDDSDSRFAINNSNVQRMLKSGAHHPSYLLEADIMYSYRVGFGGDYSTAESVDINSEATANGFKTTINSFIEYDTYASTYTSDQHEAYKFKVTINFDERGAVTSLDYKKTVFSQSQWDFTTHSPATGQTGSVKERITASYTYGAPSGETCDFDPTPYFISSFGDVQFINPALETKITAADDSYVGIDDDVYLVDSEGEANPYMVKCEYAPSTALDLWQYAPTATTDGDVIDHFANNLYYEMTGYNEGNATITITSHIPGYGASKDVNVHVYATSDIRYFYLYNLYDDGQKGYSSITDIEHANVRANGVYKFHLGVSLSTAPMIYTAESSNPSLLKVLSGANARDLIIDTTGAKNITANTEVIVTLHSDRYDSHRSDTKLHFYVYPAAVNPVGTWKMVMQDGSLCDDAQIEFTTENYDSTGKKKGVITDHYIDSYGVDHGTDTFYFWYTYDGSTLLAQVYDFTLETVTGSYVASDFVLDIYYDGATGDYGVFLAATEIIDGYDAPVFEDPIYGTVSDDWFDIAGYTAFRKVA